MVLAVRKYLQITNKIMLDNFYYHTFPIISISTVVLALGVHLDIHGAGLGPDGPGCPEAPLNDQYDHSSSVDTGLGGTALFVLCEILCLIERKGCEILYHFMLQNQ